MDFSQVKAITIPEGNVIRILSGATVLWERTGLPAEYQEVEYLESTGTQYIDTGMVLNNGCVITLDFLIADSAVNRIVYGWRRKGLFTQPYQAYITSNTRKIRQIVVGRSADVDTYPQSFEYDVRNKVLMDSVDEHVLVNGIVTDCGPDFSNGKAFDENGSSEYHPYLFALNNAGRAVAISKDTRIYGYSVQYEGELLQSFVPCYRKIDKVAGMYDVVNGVFYTNDGTGEFTVGPDIITIPSEYQKVEYIQSSGTQYIRTPVPPSDNFRMDLKVYSTCVDSFYCAGLRIGGDIIFGQTGPTANDRVSASVNGASVNASTDGVQWSRSSSGQTYDIMLRTNGNGTFTYHIKDLTNEKEFLAENRSYTLMGNVTYGICVSSLNSVYILNGTNRFYYFRLYKDGEVAFDGIPCYRKSDNVVGLYDLVSKEFLVNAGTGSFTAGPDV